MSKLLTTNQHGKKRGIRTKLTIIYLNPNKDLYLVPVYRSLV